MKAILLNLFLLITVPSFTQTLNAVRSTGMGDLSASIQGVGALFGNQAGLSKINELCFMALTEQRFLLKDLNFSGVGVAIPTSSGTFGAVVTNFGFSEFRQQKIGLSYARKIFHNFSIGAQFDYFQTKIKEYGSSGAATFEIGLQAKLAEPLIIGAHINSPIQAEISAGENLPTIMSLGLMYNISKIASVGVEVEKDVDFPLRIKSGVEYMAVPSLRIRAGFSTEPSSFHLGIGWTAGEHFDIDISNRFTQELGVVPAAGIVYRFLKK